MAPRGALHWEGPASCSMQDLQISDTGLSFVAGGMESSALRLICSARAGCWLFHDSTMPRKISKASAFWSNGPKQLTPQQLAQATPPGTVVRELLATLSQNRKLLKKMEHRFQKVSAAKPFLWAHEIYDYLWHVWSGICSLILSRQDDTMCCGCRSSKLVVKVKAQ